MKRLAFTLMIGIVALALYACEDALIDTEPTPQLSVTGEQTTPSGGFHLPEGTDVAIVNDESGRKIIRFQLPDNYRLIGRVDPSFPGLGGQVMKMPGGDITCRCTEGGGDCVPFHAHGPQGDTWGCAMGTGCTECVGTRSRVMQTESGPARVPFVETAVINLDAGISTVVTEEESEGLRCASSVLFEDPEVQVHLQQFISRYRIHDAERVLTAESREELPDNYIMAPFNVYGNLVWLPVERGASVSVTMSEVAREAARTPGGGSCSCSEGEGSCSYHRESVVIIGYTEWCESAGCTACTLHG